MIKPTKSSNGDYDFLIGFKGAFMIKCTVTGKSSETKKERV